MHGRRNPMPRRVSGMLFGYGNLTDYACSPAIRGPSRSVEPFRSPRLEIGQSRFITDPNRWTELAANP